MQQSMRTHASSHEDTRIKPWGDTHNKNMTYRSRNRTVHIFLHWSTLCLRFLVKIESFLKSLEPDNAALRRPSSRASWKSLYSFTSSTLFLPLSVNHSSEAGCSVYTFLWMMTCVTNHEDTFIEPWGHMRQQSGHIHLNMRTHAKNHEDTCISIPRSIESAFPNVASGSRNRYVPACMQAWITLMTGCCLPTQMSYTMRTHVLKHENMV